MPVKTSSAVPTAARGAIRAACCLLMLAASLASVSCRRETEARGSVFIVTRGADKQKLGLAVVSAIPADRIKRFVEAKKAVDELTAQKEAVSSRQSELNSSS